jgi:hypothetical protein
LQIRRGSLTDRGGSSGGDQGNSRYRHEADAHRPSARSCPIIGLSVAGAMITMGVDHVAWKLIPPVWKLWINELTLPQSVSSAGKVRTIFIVSRLTVMTRRNNSIG